MRNIQIIVENALCTGCGACSGICPIEAVDMVTNAAGYVVAQVNNEKCDNCGVCLAICPSHQENDIKIYCNDIFHGVCLGGYIGFAKDEEIRQKSQSGGIVTALLCYLLEKQFIESAIVNNFNKDIQRPQAVLARSKKEIISGCGSYYTQTPVIKTILENNKGRKLAAVVLGCQAESLKLIEKRYPNVELPLYTIGLICAGQNSGYMIDDLIQQTGCNSNSEREFVCSFRFRDKSKGGWPGNVSIVSDKRSYTLPKEKRLALKPVYELHRCISCFDQMNIFSDIVCGDPWHIENKKKTEGYTVVISRTEKGKRLLEDAARDGAIALEHLPIEDIFQGQTVDGRHKTKFFTAKDIYKENGWLFPYDEKYFKGISYVSANKKENISIKKRLEYSRKLYCEDQTNNIKKIIKAKKKGKLLKTICTYPMRFMKLIIYFSLKQLRFFP